MEPKKELVLKYFSLCQIIFQGPKMSDYISACSNSAMMGWLNWIPMMGSNDGLIKLNVIKIGLKLDL